LGVKGYVDSTGTQAQFGYLEGMAVDPDGNLYVADGSNQVIRRFTPAGIVTTAVGGPYVVGTTAGPSPLPASVAGVAALAFYGDTMILSSDLAIMTAGPF